MWGISFHMVGLGSYRDNGKENGNYYNILGLYRDNGKENGNYHTTLWWYFSLVEHCQVRCMVVRILERCRVNVPC